MINQDVLIQLFCRELERLSIEKHLTDEERNRITKVFQQAIADPFMTEYKIYPLLTGDESFVHSSAIYD